MASRFLRADFRRACRPGRSQSSTSTNALFSAARTRDGRSSASTARSRTNLGTAAAAATAAACPSHGWHSTSGRPLARAYSTFPAASSGGVGAVGRVDMGSSSNGGKFGCSSVTSVGGLGYGCSWRGATTGRGVLLWLGPQQAGRRSLSSRKGKASGQT